MANNKKILSDYENEYIMLNYDKKSIRRIGEDLKINPYHIRRFISENNLIIGDKIVRTQRKCDYSFEDELFIKQNYLTMDYKDIGNILGKSECAIGSKVSKMGLPLKSDKWSEREEILLTQNYPYYPNSYIVKYILPNRASDSINVKANSMGLTKHGRLRFAREDLKNKLISFGFELGRTPTTSEVDNKQEMPSASTLLRYFGSYEKACLECGMITNKCLFGKYSSNGVAKDNETICLSNAELIITNFLIDNNIKFEKEKYYSDILNEDLGLIRCDWYLVDFDVIVEYFGLHNKDFYKVKMDKKIQLCKDLNKDLIFITDRHITTKLLNDKFHKFI